MSCNGCRVLRKGCSDSCALRPCLQWIEGAEAQGHATVFVAKFFGRAGLMGFIANVPENQRPALFRSLLYESCGRTVNPVYGAVGLLWSGHWHICQAAVDTVLRGGSIKPTATSPSSLPCYGPMPNLPRLHIKSTPTPPQQQAGLDLDRKVLDHHRDDVKQRLKPADHSHHQCYGPGMVAVRPTNGEDVGHVPRPAPLDRPLLVAVKRERDEAVEIIAPVARRPRVGRPGGCQLDGIAAAEAEAIDLDLTLSSHPPTPQLFVPPRKGGGGANAAVTTTTVVNNNHNMAARVHSPVSCSNSFSSEGSVTSLDTADFIASHCNNPGFNPGIAGGAVPPGISMDLLQRMERRQQQHHHHQQHHNHRTQIHHDQ